MKVSGVRLFPKQTGAIVVVAYGYGLLLGCLSLLWSWAVNRGTPQLEWWQYLLAPFAVGAAAFALEMAATFLTNGFAFVPSASSSRLTAGKIALVVMLVLLLVAWPLYQISQQ
jgi:hypothetical protein